MSLHRAIPSVCIAALMFASQVGPSDAQLNLCKWPRSVLAGIPDHCFRTPIFYWITGALFVLAVIWGLWPWAYSRLFPPPPTIQRLPLIALLDEAKKLGWVFLGKRDALFIFEQGLRQAALDGTIQMWGIDLVKGRDLKSAPQIYPKEKIEPVYFKDHWIETHQGFVHRENAYTVTTLPAGKEVKKYSDLHATKDQAMVWLKSEGENLRRNLPPGG